MPSPIDVEHAAERHEERSHAERGNEFLIPHTSNTGSYS
jgi:hypothetical protein